MKIKDFKCMVEVWDKEKKWWDEYYITFDDLIAMIKDGCKLKLCGSDAWIDVEIPNREEATITYFKIEIEEEEKENVD